MTIVLSTFGQTKTKSDSILVSRLDLIKQIELNDKRKAQWDYCVEAVTKADSVVVASQRYIASLDTVIDLKDETISLLTLAKDISIDNAKELRKQLKAQKRKTFRSSLGWGIGGGGVGFVAGVVTILAVKARD